MPGGADNIGAIPLESVRARGRVVVFVAVSWQSAEKPHAARRAESRSVQPSHAPSRTTGSPGIRAPLSGPGRGSPTGRPARMTDQSVPPQLTVPSEAPD